MFARITRLVFSPNREDDVLLSFMNQAQPAFSGIRGYHGLIVHFDAESCTALVTTYWDSREGAEGLTETQARSDLMERLQPFLVSPPAIEITEVLFTDIDGFPTFPTS
jgi:heme-degrading monooxygenase HmoA